MVSLLYDSIAGEFNPDLVTFSQWAYPNLSEMPIVNFLKSSLELVRLERVIYVSNCDGLGFSVRPAASSWPVVEMRLKGAGGSSRTTANPAVEYPP